MGFSIAYRYRSETKNSGGSHTLRAQFLDDIPDGIIIFAQTTIFKLLEIDFVPIVNVSYTPLSGENRMAFNYQDGSTLRISDLYLQIPGREIHRFDVIDMKLADYFDKVKEGLHEILQDNPS